MAICFSMVTPVSWDSAYCSASKFTIWKRPGITSTASVWQATDDVAVLIVGPTVAADDRVVAIGEVAGAAMAAVGSDMLTSSYCSPGPQNDPLTQPNSHLALGSVSLAALLLLCKNVEELHRATTRNAGLLLA